MIPYLKSVTKAIGSGVAAFVGTVTLILSTQNPEHQGFQYITQLQWCIIVLHVLAAYGITWGLANTPIPGDPTNAGINENVPTGTTALPAPQAVSVPQVAPEPQMGQTVTASDTGKHSA